MNYKLFIKKSRLNKEGIVQNAAIIERVNFFHISCLRDEEEVSWARLSGSTSWDRVWGARSF